MQIAPTTMKTTPMNEFLPPNQDVVERISDFVPADVRHGKKHKKQNHVRSLERQQMEVYGMCRCGGVDQEREKKAWEQAHMHP